MSNLINKETGFEIATIPEKLPPLRDGYIRLIHQTHSVHAESLVEKGLVYNKEYAGMGKNPYGKNYMDAGYMSVQYTEEGFWNRLTEDGVRHMNSDVIAIFDMPAEEFSVHLNPDLACHLNGTISRGYMVGVIPNYGTKNLETEQRLSVSEMEEKKRIAKSNPLPPLYETPNWQENIEKAKEMAYAHDSNEDEANVKLSDLFGNSSDIENSNNDDNAVLNAGYSYLSGGNESDWSDWEEANCEDLRQTTKYTDKLINDDPLQVRLENLKQRLAEKNLDEYKGKTGDSKTGATTSKHKEIATIQTNAAKEVILRQRSDRQ